MLEGTDCTKKRETGGGWLFWGTRKTEGNKTKTKSLDPDYDRERVRTNSTKKKKKTRNKVEHKLSFCQYMGAETFGTKHTFQLHPSH